ncbi:hypothetical protein [Streptomyces zhihengii]
MSSHLPDRVSAIALLAGFAALAALCVTFPDVAETALTACGFLALLAQQGPPAGPTRTPWTVINDRTHQ